MLIRIYSLQIPYHFHILGTMNTFEWIFAFLVILGCVVRVAQMIGDRLKDREKPDSDASEWHSGVLKNLLAIIMIMMLINIVLFVIY